MQCEDSSQSTGYQLSEFDEISGDIIAPISERKLCIDTCMSVINEKSDEALEEEWRSQSKSNFIKNIIRAFNRFVLEDADTVIVECLDIYEKSCSQYRQQYKKFIKRHNINNSLVKDLLTNERFGQLFKYFLEVYALDWLEASVKIIDITSHVFHIVFLLRCFQKPFLLKQIKFYTK